MLNWSFRYSGFGVGGLSTYGLSVQITLMLRVTLAVNQMDL